MDASALPVVLVSLTLFAAAAYFTRAGPRRIGAALIAGVCAAALNITWDLVAAPMGWWRYTAGAPDHAAWLMYAPVALWFGAGVGLIGWRVIRAWGAPGAIVFFALFTLFGYLRDRVYDARADIFHLGPGLSPHLADPLAWLSIAVLVQIVMPAVVGPTPAEALRDR